MNGGAVAAARNAHHFANGPGIDPATQVFIVTYIAMPMVVVAVIFLVYVAFSMRRTER